MTPISKRQWQSVVLNTLFAFFAAFAPVVIASGSFDKATLTAAAVAGLMASFKIVEKLVKDDGTQG
jgi:uncharacterized membrane protein YagU involved in acid resistance